MSNKIVISVSVNGEVSKVWDCYTNPVHIVNWNFADPSWHCPRAANDLKVSGKYFARMEAKDGSFGFDFEAIYTAFEVEKGFSYSFGGREASVQFNLEDGRTRVIVAFDPESENSHELQKNGWQAILNNFKSYCETILQG